MPRNLNLKVICSALCAMSLVSLSSPAGASDQPEIPSRVVKFGDLDLTRSGGAAALYARIQHAAREVCQPVMSRDLGSQRRAHSCATRAVERAVVDVNAPQLMSYHLAKKGVTPVLVAQRN